MLERRELVAGRLVRHAVARKVERDAAKVALQARDDLAIEKAPRRIPVQHKNGFTITFINIVDTRTVNFDVAMFDWKEFPWYVEDHTHCFSLARHATD